MRRASILLAASFAIGCAGSPNPVFYALSSRAGAPVASQSQKVEVRRPGIPGYLDRPYIVRRATPERLYLAADERWAAPLENMVGTTLVENLSSRLPGCSVFSEAGSLSTPADVRVEVEITRFEMGDDGYAELAAQVALDWSAPNATRIERHSFRSAPKTRTTGGLVASLSDLLGQLSDAVVQTLKLGPPPAPPRANDVAPETSNNHEPPVLVPVAPNR